MKTTAYLKTVAFVLCIMLAGCSSDEPVSPPQPINEIALNQTVLTLNVQDTDQLRVTTDINNKPITWISDAPKVVRIDENGNITALRGGTATITAQVDNAEATCTITVNPDVYVLGSRRNESVIWKNGEIFKESTSFTSDFFVTEKGIYTINGAQVLLNSEVVLDLSNNPTGTTVLRSIYVVDEDVYVCGSTRTSNTNIAKVWKNATEQILTNANSQAINLVVNNDDVYVLGTEQTSEDPMRNKIVLWKNQTATDFTDDDGRASAHALFVDETDVYIGGSTITTRNFREDTAIMWKNEVEISLAGDGKIVRAIFVRNDDVYVAGSENVDNEENSRAVYWKNGIKTNLTEGTTKDYSNDIVVYDNDVYVVVTKSHSTVNNNTTHSLSLFKNEQETILRAGSDHGFSTKLFLY